ncbi:hypothetical protein EV715DRAFT_297851 [Schizophyllum commune]
MSSHTPEKHTIHQLMENPVLFEPMPRPRYPLVLCHGLYDFDTRRPDSLPSTRMHYWASGRSNTLRFDDYTSRTQFMVSTWPLSVILYLVYSAELRVGEDLMGRRDTILGYVDDTAYVVVGDSIAQNAEKLKAVAE